MNDDQKYLRDDYVVSMTGMIHAMQSKLINIAVDDKMPSSESLNQMKAYAECIISHTDRLSVAGPDVKIPDNVVWNVVDEAFYRFQTDADVPSLVKLGNRFKNKWYDQRARFPQMVHDEIEITADMDAPPAPPVQIPKNVYWSEQHDNFYDMQKQTGMGTPFYSKWHYRRHEFPKMNSVFNSGRGA